MKIFSVNLQCHIGRPCACGCGKHVKPGNRFINGHNTRGKKFPKQSKRMKKNNPLYDPVLCKRQSERMMGNQITKGYKHSEEFRKLATERFKKRENPSKNPEIRKRLSEIMKNGGSVHANSFNQTPSRPQIELYKLIEEIYPNSKLEYPSLNYLIDIAIPDLMIAIEYDGSYWHQNEEADLKRQKELESIGWQFLRYIDCIPKIEQLKKDLEGII